MLNDNKIVRVLREAIEHCAVCKLEDAMQFERGNTDWVWKDSEVVTMEGNVVDQLRMKKESRGGDLRHALDVWLGDDCEETDLIDDLVCLRRRVGTLLAGSARQMRSSPGGGIEQNGSPRETSSVYQQSQQERLYSQIVQSFVASAISEMNDVKEFRSHLPNGRLPTESDAWEFITRETCSVLDFKDFVEQGFCPVATKGRVERLDDTDAYTEQAEHDLLLFGGYVNQRANFVVSLELPEGEIKTMTISRVSDTYAMLARRQSVVRSYVHYVSPELGRVSQYDFYSQFRTQDSGDVEVVFDDKFYGRLDAGHTVCGFWPSITGRALYISHLISERFHIDARDALCCLLMAQMPEQSTMEARSHRNHQHNHPYQRGILGSVSISVQPWVHPKAIETFYAKTVLRRDSVTTGNAVQPLPPEADLQLYKIVNELTKKGQTPAWSDIARSDQFTAWKKQYNRKISNEAARSNISIIYGRVEKHLARWQPLVRNVRPKNP